MSKNINRKPHTKPIEKGVKSKSDVKHRYWLLKHKYLIVLIPAIIAGIFGFLNNWFGRSSKTEPHIGINSNKQKVVNQKNPNHSPVIMGDQNNFNIVEKREDNFEAFKPNIISKSIYPAKYPMYVGRNVYRNSDSLYFLISLVNNGKGEAYNLVDEEDCLEVNHNKSIADKYFWIGENYSRTFSKNLIVKSGESKLIDYSFPSYLLNDTVFIYFKLTYTDKNKKKGVPIEAVLEFRKGNIENNLPFASSEDYDDVLKWVKIFKARHARFLQKNHKNQ
ncbi:hypothetical protein [Mucilaginibacter sp.]|jgi:hypothetical protein|uniref:hypothetical protein n=1 Tax=Mucilaginibacter sp. TaxID=1882438 RepID=UPI002C322731|nr:hypothetical protein [Mucilaginibacter sp.]HTI59497.1 hypothetical protein [Mucilaginibacter sp.]